jgi:hypothetical protein
MPDTWNAEVYRERARRWQAAADKQPVGSERDACLNLVEGYDRLADLIDKSRVSDSWTASKRPAGSDRTVA